jgi:hypothetical protein
MTFLTLFAATTLGSFLGNLAVFSAIGYMAQRTEKKRLDDLKQFQNQVQQMVQNENERMRRYAELEN